MALPQIYLPGLAQIRSQFGGQRPGYKHEVVAYVKGQYNTNLTLAVLTNLQLQWDGLFRSFWNNMSVSTWQYLGSIVTDRNSNTGLAVDNSGYTPVAGLLPGPAAGEQVAVLVSWKSSTRYKGGHGRWYVPGLSTGAMQDDTSLASNVVTELQSSLQGLRNGLNGIAAANGGPFDVCTLHQRQHQPGTGPGVPGPAIPPYIEIPTRGQVNALLATQRRRLRKAPHH